MSQLLAIAIGGLLSIMISMNGELGSAIGNYGSSVLIHVIGLVTISIVLVVTKSKVELKRGIPFYVYLGGAIGVFTVLFNNLSVFALGVSLTIALGLLGQSITSILIDHYGWFGLSRNPFNPKKLIGLGLIILGISIMAIY
ncbi:MAG TPA: hypothetical protein DCY20_05850 [Firmicutes bacterium]|nr:hypothetical protein [Bacillota bacterium]